MALSKKAKRWIKIVAAVIIGLPILLIVILFLFLGTWIEAGIEYAGPKLMGVETQVEDVSVSVLGGHISLKGLLVANPEGYTTPSFVKADLISVSANIPALLKKEIHLREVILDGPEFTYEVAGGKSNLGVIMDNLKGDDQEGKSEGEKDDEKKEESDPYRWKIDRILVKNAKLRGAALGESVSVTIDEIELTDIQDAEGNGLAMNEILGMVLRNLASNLQSVVSVSEIRKDLEDLTKGSSEKVKGILKEAISKPKQVIEGGIDTLKGIIGK